MAAFLPPRHLPPLRRPRRPAITPIKASWEDSLLRPPRRPTPHPSTHESLHLLSLSSRDALAYATAQPLGPRTAYARTSSALPLPFDRSDKPLLHDAFIHLGTPLAPLPARAEPPSRLLATLGVSRAQCVRSGNAALGVLQMIVAAGAELSRVEVEEAPSTAFELRGVLFLRVPRRLGGGTVFAEEEVFVTPAFATAVGNVAGVDVYVERVLFEEASVRVEDMVRVYEARGGVPVVEGGVGRAVEEGETVVPWEISAAEVDGLPDEVLRATLRKCRVGVTRKENREALLRKFVGLMDEVQRRELGVLLAAREGLYGMAGELQKGRSKRGRLIEEMKEAERKGNWAEVVKIGMMVRKLEAGIMDITAEPGSYGRDLDRDDWYQPNR